MRFVFLDAVDVTIEANELEGVCEVVALGLRHEDDIPDWIGDEDVQYIGLWHTIHLDEKALKKLKSCKAIIRLGVGYDNVDIRAAAKLKIAVCNVPAYGTEEVADSALSFIIDLFRQTTHCTKAVMAGKVIRGSEAIALEAQRAKRMRGATLGIIGLGAIGTAVAKRAQVFGMEVVFYDPYVTDGYAKALTVTRCDSVLELAAISECVTVHCLLNHETRGLIGEEFLKTMPKGAFVVNTSRGPIIDEVALLAALKSGHIGGAGLDVFNVEPVTLDNPLVLLDNTICTPHNAWFSQESMVEMRTTAAQYVARVLQGKPLRNIVNKHFFEQ